jgi:hypothetical protein
VPKSAVHGAGENTFIWLVRNEQVAKVPVRVGEDFGETVYVLSGLDGGEALIVTGPDNMVEGLRVQAKVSKK